MRQNGDPDKINRSGEQGSTRQGSGSEKGRYRREAERGENQGPRSRGGSLDVANLVRALGLSLSFGEDEDGGRYDLE